MSRNQSAQPSIARPKFLIVYAGDLDAARFDSSETPGHDSFLERLDAQPADAVLESLRSWFSWTYERYDSYAALPAKLVTIRNKVADALLPLNELLRTLKLKPVGDDKSLRKRDDQIVHKFVFADARALRLKVEQEGKRRWFTEVIQNQPGDEVLAAARDVLSRPWQSTMLLSPSSSMRCSSLNASRKQSPVAMPRS